LLESASILRRTRFDVDFDEIREGIERFIPYVFRDFRPSHNGPALRARYSSSAYSLAVSVTCGPPWKRFARQYPERGRRRQFWRAELAGAAQQTHEDARATHGIRRLGEVIVSTVIEADDAVLDGIASGQHQNRHALAGLRSSRQTSKPLGPGIITIEDHEVVSIDRCLIQRIVAGIGDINSVRLFAQALGHESRDTSIVFDKQ